MNPYRVSKYTYFFGFLLTTEKELSSTKSIIIETLTQKFIFYQICTKYCYVKIGLISLSFPLNYSRFTTDFTLNIRSTYFINNSTHLTSVRILKWLFYSGPAKTS